MQKIKTWLQVAVVAIVVLLLTLIGAAQNQSQTQTIHNSGDQITVVNNINSTSASFTENISGSPATMSIVIQGCTSSSCTTLDTYTGTTTSKRTPTISSVYTSFVIAATWTGGTTVSVTVNSYLVAGATGVSTCAGLSDSGTGCQANAGTGSSNYAAGNDSRITSAVPNSTTVNSHPLSSNVTVTAADTGAVPTGGNAGTATALASAPSLCTAGQIPRGVLASGNATGCIDFPDVKFIPAANCNNATAGDAWGIGSGGTVTCRAGTNNLGGFILITDTSSTFATFQVTIPEDWDSSSNPYIRFQIASTDATNGHTVIPSIQVGCYKGDGSTTDDVAANAAHSLSTTTLNGNANRFWSGSNVQMNSTDMTGCVAGALMQVTVGRATDTATNAEFYGATITFPRLLAVQAN